MVTKYTHQNYNFTDLLIFVIILLSIKLYTLFIPYGATKFAVLLGEIIVLVFLAVHFVYDHSKRISMGYKWEITLIFFSLILSTFAAEIFHNQGISKTLFAQYDFYFFLFYFLLHYLKPDPKKMLQMFLVLGYIYVLLYLIQYFLYPRIIVSSRVSAERGTIRIFIPGIQYMFTSYFILLGRFFQKKQIKYILALIPIIVIVFLLGTRQLLSVIMLLTLLNILFSKTVKSKVFMYILIASCIIPFYFAFEGIFNEILMTSQQQFAEGATENIRYKAAYYYLFNFNSNPLWMLVGNGAPGINSDYGRQVMILQEEYGYYQSDIGIIGEFFKFGIIFVIAQFVLLYKMLITKLPEEFKFIIYNVLSIFFTMLVGAGLHAATIGLLCFMMYFADISRHYSKTTAFK
ncbi:MAG: hypothetical protein JW894_08380 [Bacteroidales bacterium]|nr:hypothetical protein [Bacteroidales bacterium]